VENLFILGGYSLLSESSAPFAAPESLQRDPVVRVQMSDLSGVMVTINLAPIIMQKITA
jgi:hypothetical protein